MGRADAYSDTRTVAVSDGFFRLEQGDGAIHFRAVDSTTATRDPLPVPSGAAVTDCSPRGDVLGIDVGPSGAGIVLLDDSSVIDWIDQPPASRWGLTFSPDGASTAYASDESGQFEIWVGSLTTSSARQLSAGGGIEPVWCRCNEIFFRRGNEWLSARVIPGEPPTWETPRSILMVDDFLDTPGRSYDVSSDGQKLFVVQRAEPAIDDRIHVVSNWFEELKRLVPSP